MQKKFFGQKKNIGQSFVELAIFFPILLLLLAVVVEIGLMFFFYMTAVDLTREASRFASTRDYREQEVTDPSGLPESACADTLLHYYYDTSCFFIDPTINPYITISPTNYGDVTISILTVTDGVITNRWPEDGDGVWSLFSNPLGENWRFDCQGNLELTEPYFTNEELEAMFVDTAPANRGLVLVEFYYCYNQIMNLPILSDIIEDPTRFHAYTIMPAPEGIPTPTPIP